MATIERLWVKRNASGPMDPAESISLTTGQGIDGNADQGGWRQITVIATVDEAKRRGWPSDFVAAWLTVQVHSSLEAVGLTAAMSRVLTEHQIPCNVIAGFYHDHLLVPADRVDEAIETILSLAESTN